MCYYRMSANDRTIANSQAVIDKHILANPNIMTYSHMLMHLRMCMSKTFSEDVLLSDKYRRCRNHLEIMVSSTNSTITSN